MAVSYTLTNPRDLSSYQAAVEGSQLVETLVGLLSDSKSGFSKTRSTDLDT